MLFKRAGWGDFLNKPHKYYKEVSLGSAKQLHITTTKG